MPPLFPRPAACPNTGSKGDPILQELAGAGVGTVYATDTVMTALMCCTRAFYSFDVVMTKRDGKIWIDKRDESELDFLEVRQRCFE